MQIEVRQEGAEPVIRHLREAPTTIRDALAKEAFAIVARAVRYIKDVYRSRGGPDSTWVRSAQLRNSYSQRVDRDGGDVVLNVGAIQPTDNGQVPIQARVQEGFDAAGNRVAQFVITPKKGNYLTFPIRDGGGLAASSIIGWVRVKRVVLRPRPALEPTSPAILQALTDRAGQVVADAL